MLCVRLPPLFQIAVEQDCKDDDDALCYQLVMGMDSHEIHPIVDDTNDQGTDECVPDRTPTAHEARPAENNSGNGIQFKPFPNGMVLLGLTTQERSKLNRFEEIETVRKIDPLTLRIGDREIQGISFFKR